MAPEVSRSSAQAFEGTCLRNCCYGSLGTLVERPWNGAGHGLRGLSDGKHPECNGNPGIEGCTENPSGSLSRDVLVVVRVALDHSTEGDHRIEAARLSRDATRER